MHILPEDLYTLLRANEPHVGLLITLGGKKKDLLIVPLGT